MHIRKIGAALLAPSVLLSAAFATTVVARTGYATNFGSSGTVGISGTNNGVWKTTDNAFAVIQRDLTQTYTDGVTTTVDYNYDPIADFSAWTYSASNCPSDHFDTCVFDDNYGDNNLNGWNACLGTASGSHPSQVCATQWVRINTFYSPPATRVACHEIGHSAGLRHTSAQSSCMKQTSAGGNAELTDAHDDNHLTTAY